MRRCLACLVVALMLAGAARAVTLFGLVNTGELFVSDDGGTTWSVRSTLPVSDAIGVAAAETVSELYLATRSGVVYRSTDAGLNWTGVGSVAASDVAEMLILSNGDILLLTGTGIVWLSTDDGTTFTSLSTLTASNAISLTRDYTEMLYALTQTGEVARSTDGGTSWTTIGTIATTDAVEIRAVVADLFVLTGTGDIYRSTDHGMTWTAIGTISQVHMKSLVLDGTNLVAATSEGLIASSGDGSNWNWVGSINQLAVVALGNDTPSVTGVGPERPPAFSGFRMGAPWPNPRGTRGGATSFTFYLPVADALSIAIYDVQGKLVAQRRTEFFAAPGEYLIQWDFGNVRSGVYFVRGSTSGGLAAHRKIVVVR